MLISFFFIYIDLMNASFRNKTSIANFRLETYSKTCVKWPLSTIPKIVFQDQYYRLMQVKSIGIAECSKGNILQYFRPLLGCHLSLRSLFYLFLSGCSTQVLLYCEKNYDSDVNNNRKAMTSCSCTGKLIMHNRIPFFIYYHMDFIARKPDFMRESSKFQKS